MEVGGIEPPSRVVGQGLTGHCDQIVTVFWSPETTNVDWPSLCNSGRTQLPSALTFVSFGSSFRLHRAMVGGRRSKPLIY